MKRHTKTTINTILAAFALLAATGCHNQNALTEKTAAKQGPAAAATVAMNGETAGVSTPAVANARPAAGLGGRVVGSKYVTTAATDTVAADDVMLLIDSGAVRRDVQISIVSTTEEHTGEIPSHMENLTAGGAVYRMLPDGQKFEKDITIAMRYDSTALPYGYTAEDIYTFFYNEETHLWQQVERDSVDTQHQIVYSRTNHFTDYINGVLKVPESSDATSYTPTSIKDLKAADPLEGITLMAPPEANNMGTANLSYPLTLPAGRNDLQPELSINYNSAGGSGILGLGWSLPISEISVDTRRGVPLFKNDLETETYTLDGEILVTSFRDDNGLLHLNKPAYATQWKPRNHNVNKTQFYPRVEGAFRRIERMGTSTTNYYWVVTDKDGTKYYYGESDGSRFKDASGHIVKWCLTRVVDTYGNEMTYKYTIRNYNAPGNPNTARQILLSKINYTSHRSTNTPGRYNVNFVYSSDNKRDAVTSARYGFLEADAALLDRIVVDYDGNAITNYVFGYKEGAFGRTLLCNIIEADPSTSNSQCTDCTGQTNDGDTNYNQPGSIFCGDRKFFSSFMNDGFQGPGNYDLPYLHPVPHTYPDSCLTDTLDYYSDHTPQNQVMNNSIFFRDPYDRCATTDSTCTRDGYTEHVFRYSGIEGDILEPTIYITNKDQKDVLHGPLFVAKGDPGLLEGSGTKTWNLGGGIDVGFGWNTFLKSTTLGGSYTYSSSDAEGLVTLIDLNGDGYSDKVFKQNNKLYYRLRDNADPKKFLPKQQIDGINDFLVSTSESNTWGIEGSIGTSAAGVNFGVNWTDGNSTTTTYFSDLDGDGLPDLVRNGKVYYNRILENPNTPFQCAAPGVEYVVLSSCDNSDTVFIGQPVDDWVFDDYVDSSIIVCDTVPVPCPHCGYANCGVKGHETLDSIDCHPYRYTQPRPYQPNLENVRFWESPEDYDVRVTDSYDMPVSEVAPGDGVRLIIQLGKEGIIKDKNIQPGDSGHLLNDTVIHIKKHQRLYFRTLARNNRTADRLSWNPVIVIADNNSTGVPISGGSSATVVAPTTTTSINSVGIDENRFDYREDFLLSGLQKIMIPFNSRVCIENTVYDIAGHNPAGSAVCEVLVNGTVNYTIPVGTSTTPDVRTLTLNKYDKVQVRIVAKQDPFNWSDIQAHCHMYITDNLATDDDNSYVCVDNYSSSQPVYFFDYYPQVQKLVYDWDKNPDKVYMYSDYTTSKHSRFGTMYRNWGQFAYKAPEYRNSDMLFESLLNTDDLTEIEHTSQSNYENVGNNATLTFDNSSQETSATIGGLPAYNPLASSFFVMQPDFKRDCWSAYSDYAYIEQKMLSLLPHPADGLTIAQVENSNYSCSMPIYTPSATVVSKQSYNNSFGFSGNVGIDLGFSLSVGGSWTRSESRQLSDMIDLNGDGLPDVISEIKAQYSQPFGGLGSTTGLLFTDNLYCEHSHDTVFGGSFGGSAVRMTAMPSNGPRSALKSVSGNVGSNIGGTYGHGNSSTTWVDINGDGLPDKVYSDNGTLYYYQNTGYGLLPRARFSNGAVRRSTSLGFSGGGSISGLLGLLKYKNTLNVSITVGMGVSYSENSTDVMTTDLNGDGLPDRITKYGGGYLIKFNSGTGFDWSNAVVLINNSAENVSFTTDLTGAITAGVTLGFIPIKIEGNIKGGLSRSLSRTEAQWTDIDADGVPDYVWDAGNGRIGVRHSNLGTANRLIRVTLPTGGTYEMAYELNNDGPESNSRHYVMSSLTVKDNRMQSPTQTTTFQYSSRHYDRNERDDYGYAQVTTTEKNGNANYRRTVQMYHNQDYMFRGRCYDTRTVDVASGKTISGEMHDFRLFEIETGDYIVGSGPGCHGDGWPSVRFSRTFYYDNSQPRITSQIRFGYTSFGNVDTVYDDGDLNDPTDDYVAVSVYTPMGDYIVNTVTEEIVYAGSEVYRHREAAYNNKGDIEKLTFHNNASADAIHEFKHDSYGNITLVLQPENHQGQRFIIEYDYDNVIHSLPVKTSNSYGLISYAKYNYYWQKPEWTKSVNGAETKYTYDNQGRLIEMYAPFEYGTGNATIRHQYYDEHPQTEAFWRNCRIWARTLNRADAGTTINTVGICDGLGRQRIVKRDASVNGQHKRIVSDWTEFDALGRKVREYHPYVENITAADSTIPLINPASSQPYTSYTYDAMDRVTATLYPDGNSSTSEYSIAPDADGTLRLKTLNTDQNGDTSSTYNNVRDAQTTTINGVGAVTRYHYDPVGQLVETIDPESHSTFHQFDMMGRRISRDHPSAGHTEWEYDPAGNLVIQTVNSGQQIEYRYDYNRPMKIIYSDNPWNNVSYEYGTSGTEAGRILVCQDATGSQFFKYDLMGNVIHNMHTYVFPNSDRPLTLNTSWEYDSWGRVRTIIYPDGEKVVYTYDDGGKLRAIEGTAPGHEGYTQYIRDIRYDRFGQRTRVVDGDDVVTEYTYNPLTRRLEHLTEQSTNTGEILQDNTYEYDLVGNILAIYDNGRNQREQRYEYDAADRLVFSRGEMQNEAGTGIGYGYKTTFKYSPAGRLQRKCVGSSRLNTSQGPHYVEYENDFYYANPDNPYAVTEIQDPHFGGHYDIMWDANGNLARSHSHQSGTDRQLCWTEDNRLQAFRESSPQDGIAAWYNYNADGERNIKFTSPSLHMSQNAQLINNPPLIYPTLYASSLITVSKHGYTKHYFEEERRICSKIGGGFRYIDHHSFDDYAPTIEDDYFRLHYNQYESVINTYQNCMHATPEILSAIDLYEVIAEHENHRDEPGETYYYHSDHLGSAAYLTNHGSVVQTLNYLPYGEDWVEYNYFDPSDTTRLGIYRFNGKEKDYESGFHYYGARYHWAELPTGWLSVDPQTDDLPSVSPYSYCNDNPVVLNDPDGEFPVAVVIWAAVGAAVDYGVQVYNNYSQGKTGSDAWTDVNWASVAASAFNPCGKAKTSVTVAKVVVETAGNAIEFKANKNGVSLSLNKDVKQVATKTAVSLVSGKAGEKLYRAGSAAGVKQANKGVQNAQNNLNKAQVKNTNAPSKANAQRVDKAKSAQQAARNKQVASKMSHASGAGRSKGATTTVTTTAGKVATNNPNKTNN